MIFDFILITCLLDIVLILLGEILFWSLLKVQGLKGILELKIILFAIKIRGKTDKVTIFFSKILLQRYQMNPVARLIIQMEFGVLKNSFRSLLFAGAIKFVY